MPAILGNTDTKLTPLLDVSGLSVSFGDVRVLDKVDINVEHGEIVGIVGESGSGKSTLLKAISRLLARQAKINSGTISFCSHDLLSLNTKEMAGLRGSAISYMFQNGELSLDPLFTIKSQFDEVIRAHRICQRGKEASIEEELLAQTGIEDPARVLSCLPSELSGGICQRVVLAMALAGRPKLLLADEPTSALDVDSQERVGTLLQKTSEEHNIAILIVGHDIDFIASLASRIYVMKDGIILESGNSRETLSNPKDGYTKQLIAAIPKATRRFVEVDRVDEGAM